MKLVLKNSRLSFVNQSEDYLVHNVSEQYIRPDLKLGNASGYNVNIVKVNNGDVIEISGKFKVIGYSYCVYNGVPSSFTDVAVLQAFTENAQKLIIGESYTSGDELTINDEITITSDNCVLITSNQTGNESRTLKIVKNGTPLN